MIGLEDGLGERGNGNISVQLPFFMVVVIIVSIITAAPTQRSAWRQAEPASKRPARWSARQINGHICGRIWVCRPIVTH